MISGTVSITLGDRMELIFCDWFLCKDLGTFSVSDEAVGRDDKLRGAIALI